MVLLKLDEEIISHCRLSMLKLNARQVPFMPHCIEHSVSDVPFNSTEVSLNKRVPLVRQKHLGGSHPK